jgi:arabinose-5-phosphate isomerase
MDSDRILARAREILEIEAGAVREVASRLGDPFVRLVRAVLEGKGKVLTSGVGKSGIIAKKTAATLSSTGTPSFYLNPLNALHGDLGIVSAEDILLALSNSGETQEILTLIQVVKPMGIRVAAITGAPDSTLASLADWTLNVAVSREACSLGLAPTASTTACLAAGDALALIVMEERSFQPQDFARLHPGGSLRGRLTLKVRDIMRSGDRLPVVREDEPFSRALEEMTAKESIGVALVTGAGGRLTGVLTDGDLRRFLQREKDPVRALSQPVKLQMTANPKVVEPDAAALEALRIMEVKGITSLAIVDSTSRPAGLVHLHDILGRGQFSI